MFLVGERAANEGGKEDGGKVGCSSVQGKKG